MNNHLVLLPVIIPLVGAMIGIALRHRRKLQAWWSFASMLAALGSSAWLLAEVWQSGPVLFHSGGWQAPFGIVLVGDLLSATMVVMSHLVLTAGILYALGCKDVCIQYPMFYPVFLLLATGLVGAFLTGDLFNLFVFTELLVICGTVLTAIADDRYGTEAAYKYFYMSLLASMFLLLGVGSLYIAYGTLNMADLANRIAVDPDQPLLLMAVALLMATFMVKSAVFPFHFWQPDFHAAAPTPVSAMLSSVVVKLGVYGFLRMTTLLFIEQAPLIQGLLIFLGIIGVVYGGLSAIGTHNVKRMLAYSTLAQIGFILVGIGWGTPLSITAAIVFTFNHSLVKAAMLMLAGTVASYASIKSAAFNVVTGVGKYAPLTGPLFFIGSLALVGIPPTNGFVSKMLLFRSGIDALQLTALALIGLGSVLTIIYTTRAFERIWWQPLGEGIEAKKYGDKAWAPLLLIGLVLLLGLWADPLLRLAEATSHWLTMPAAYVEAVLGG